MLGRLLTLVMLAITWTNAWADYYVTGDNATIFGSTWNPSTNKLTETAENSRFYLFQKSFSAFANNTTVQYKFTGGSWGNNEYPSSGNLSITIPSGTSKVAFYYNGNINSYGCFFTFKVAGDADLMGSNWNTSDANNEMTYDGAYTATLTKTGVQLEAKTYNCKVAFNNSWTVAYPSSNYNITVGEAGVYDVTFTFDLRDFSLSHTLTRTDTPVIPDTYTYYVVGNTAELWGAEWAVNSAGLMSTSNDVNYTLSKSNVSLTTGTTYGYKVVQVNDRTQGETWIPDGMDNENTFTVDRNGTYNLTINYTVGDDAASHSLTLVEAAPDTYVVVGPASFWGSDWDGTDENNKMTTADDGATYTLTKPNVSLAAGATYEYKVKKNNSTWYPSDNNKTFSVNLNGTYNLVITIDTQSGEVSHTLTLVQAEPMNFIVAGSEAIFGTEWNDTDENNKMTTSGDGTVYTLTKENVILDLGTTYEYKVKNGNAWIPADDNKTFTVDIPGRYNITFTYDISTGELTHTLTLVEAGAQNHFKVYVRSSDDARVFLYAWNGSTTFNGTFAEAMAANLPTVHNNVDNHDWYYLEFDTYFSSYNLIAKTAGGTQTADINGITAPEVYIVYRPDGTYFYSTQGPSTIDGLYLMGIVGNQKWSANAGTELTNNGDGTFTKNNVSLVEGATFSLASRKGETTDDWEHLLPNLFYPAGNQDYLVQEKDMGVKVYLGGRGKAAYNQSNFMMEISDSYDILVNMNDMTVTFTPSFGTVYILGEISYLDLDYSEKTQAWAPNVGSRMRTTDGKIYKRNLTLANGATFSFSTKLATSSTDWNEGQGTGGFADSRFGAVSNGDFDVTDAMIDNVQPLSLSTDGTHEAFKMATGASKGHYIMTVDMQNHTLTLKRTYVPSGEVIVHLEKTNNVTNPILKASFLGTDYNAVDEHGNTRVHENEEYVTVDGRKWWSWTIDNSISDIYIYDNVVSDGSLIINSGKRSGEIFFTYESGKQDEVTRNYENLGAEGVADCATMLEGHHYVYFTNTPGWQNVYTYMWSMDETQLDEHGDPIAVYKKAYPGDRCSLVGYDDEGYEIWMFDLTAAGYDHPTPEFIIFNDGSNAADKQQSGDFVYHEGACYDYLSTIYLGNSLANIIAQGVVTKGPQYTVEDELVGVKVIREDTPIYDPTDGHLLRTAQYALYAKDMNNYLAPSLIEKEGQIDYMFQRSPLMQGKGRSRYDQSNWVKIVISPTMVKEGSEIEVGNAEKNVLDQYVGKVIKGGTLHANIVNNVNPEMHMLEIDTEGKTSNYPENLNVYIPASFVGTQPCDDESHNPANEYFFVAPKPQEYCEISWAVYNGNTNPPIFCMPTKSFLNGHWNNEGNLSGAFLYDLTLNALNDGDENPNLVTGEAYSFKAIIRKAEAGNAQNAPRRVEQMEPKGDAALAQSTGYLVMPLNLTGSNDQIVTGIDRVDNVSQVVETRYIDLQGRVSNMPHSGVNVVVTRYSDGSTTTRKVMF